LRPGTLVSAVPGPPPRRGARPGSPAGTGEGQVGQHIYAATYGDPPDPPATTAAPAALTEARGSGEQRPAHSPDVGGSGA